MASVLDLVAEVRAKYMKRGGENPLKHTHQTQQNSRAGTVVIGQTKPNTCQCTLLLLRLLTDHRAKLATQDTSSHAQFSQASSGAFLYPYSYSLCIRARGSKSWGFSTYLSLKRHSEGGPVTATIPTYAHFTTEPSARN